uniref:CHHC U11-48K-type domain-containing protein n=1 Tax=Heliothis virescens TaxID=7102 RepID=A0A2A4JAK0_HELVI
MMDDEEYTTCPYDKSHRIAKSRIQHHIVKCQKSWPKLLICPFNATHRYPEHLIKEHCYSCPDRQPEDDHMKKPPIGTVGALTMPRPLLQKEYLPENDPESDYWDK